MFSALKSATKQVNVPFKTGIDEQTLLMILQGECDISPWTHHIYAFFTELPQAHVKKLIVEYGLNSKIMESVCTKLPEPFGQSCKAKLYGALATSF